MTKIKQYPKQKVSNIFKTEIDIPLTQLFLPPKSTQFKFHEV
jgi:hypothetical protein